MSGDDPKNLEPSVSQTISEATATQLNNLSGILDGAINIASDAVKNATAAAKDEASKLNVLAKNWYQIAATGINQADEAVMSTLKQGVTYAVENENASIAVVVALATIILPGPRRALYRMTIARFQTPEAAQRAAEQRILSIGEIIDSQAAEAQKLGASLAHAKEEYSRALSNLKSAASDMRGLASQVESTERKIRNLMHDLRTLRSKHALQMRSDVAVKMSQLTKQKNAVDKAVDRLARDGF